MENIVDVEYREVTELEELSTEVLAQQANIIYRQAEAVATVSMQLVAEAGRRLIVIKDRIGHGGWEEWMKNNLEFSSRKANQMMKLAEKADEEGSLFSNPQMFADIGISKIWALLSAPEEVAEEVLENPDAESMTVKELKAEIEKIKTERAAIAALSEDEQAELKTLRETAEKQKEEIQRLEENLLEEAGTNEEAERELEELKEKLKQTKKRLAEERTRASQLEKKARTDAFEQANRKIEEAKAAAEKDAQKAVEEQTEQIRAEEAAKRADLEAENQKLKKMADPVMTEFKLRADTVQKDFNALLAIVSSAEEAPRERMKTALKAVLKRMEEQL